MKKVGCRPPHWDKIIDIPDCSKQEQMKQFYWMNVTGQYPPCKYIQKVLHTYEEVNYIEGSLLKNPPSPNDTYFKVKIQFEDSMFMEIKHVRAFDIQNLIGNAGGYLGLFTGYALLQVPNLVVFVVNRIYKTLKDAQKMKPVVEEDTKHESIQNENELHRKLRHLETRGYHGVMDYQMISHQIFNLCNGIIKR